MIEDNKIWLKRIRNYAGLLGGLLPFLSILSAVLYSLSHGGLPAGFWKDLSISETYYISPALPGILTTASVILMCYKGYDKWDNRVTTLSGVFGIMIVLFPCECVMSEPYVGFFQLPVFVSNIVHCISALIFFALLAVNSFFLFTKNDGDMTDRKKIRNIVYKVCGVGMAVTSLLLILPSNILPAKVWLVEMIALLFFAISWLTKGEAFPFLNDKTKDDE